MLRSGVVTIIYTSLTKAREPLYFKGALNRGSTSSGASSIGNVEWHTAKKLSANTIKISGNSADVVNDVDIEICSAIGLEIANGSVYADLQFATKTGLKFSGATAPYPLDYTHNFVGSVGQNIGQLTFKKMDTIRYNNHSKLSKDDVFSANMLAEKHFSVLKKERLSAFPNVTIFNAQTPLLENDGFIDISNYIPKGKQLIAANVLVNIGGNKWVTLPYTDEHKNAAYFSKHHIDLDSEKIIFHNLGIRLRKRPCRVKLEWIDS